MRRNGSCIFRKEKQKKFSTGFFCFFVHVGIRKYGGSASRQGCISFTGRKRISPFPSVTASRKVMLPA